MLRSMHPPVLCLALLVAPSLALAQDSEPFPTAAPESQGIESAALREIAAEVAGFVERDMIVGAELLVVKNRRTVLHECFGLRDKEDGEAWVPGTVCNIRSMTKPLTGAAAQILVDRGLLSLDDPVALFLPGFDTDAARAITVRQVISHRAGLPLTILESMDQFEDLVAMGDAVGARGPEFPPDSRFWYSDSGTDVLGAIVEVVSERRLDEFVHEELLVPLGMDSSFYYLDDDDPRRADVASLYLGGVNTWERFWNPDEKAFYPFAWGSQSLYSTPPDYARFLAMWMDRGMVGERRVLSEAAVERTLTARSQMSMLGSEARFPTSFHGLEVFYGQMAVLHLPIEAGGKGPATIVGHSGSDGTIAWAWPARDLMILLFTQSRGAGAVLRIEEVIDRVLIAPEAYGGTDEVPAELEPFLGTYLADYASHMKEDFEVLVKRGKLVLDVPSQMAFELVPAKEEGRWNFAIAPGISVWFTTDEEGVVDCLKIRQGPMTFDVPRKGSALEKKLTEENRPDPEVVGKYLGTYHDPEADEELEVFIDGDYLALRTASDKLFHLWKVPGENAWLVRQMPMMTIGFQEEDGAVVALSRAGPAGKTSMPRVD